MENFAWKFEFGGAKVLRFEGVYSPRRREGREGREGFYVLVLASRARECTGSGADGQLGMDHEDLTATGFWFLSWRAGCGSGRVLGRTGDRKDTTKTRSCWYATGTPMRGNKAPVYKTEK